MGTLRCEDGCFAIGLAIGDATWVALPERSLEWLRIDQSFSVRFWPKVDMPDCTAHVRFQG
jgi:hypothetical protein